MRLTVATRLVLCLVALAGIVLPEIAAAQCFGQCVVVSPPFCRRCVESEVETGVLCRNSGTCGCFYVQCAFQPGQEQNEVQATLTELGLGAPVVVPTSCLSAADQVAPPLAAVAKPAFPR